MRTICQLSTIFLLVFLSFFSCTPIVTLQANYDTYKVSSNKKVDSALVALLKPYKDSLSKNMDEVIGFSVNGLTKKQPESVLGNFMTDAFKTMGEKKFNKKITAAFVNFGGIRSYLPKGDISVGKVFELMPFDNMIVLQDLTGKQLKEFLEKACEKGGWPVSAGLTYSIKEKKLSEVLVDGKIVDDNSIYTIANSDYIANGGDNCDMLKPIAKQSMNYLMRDAIIEYIKLLTSKNESVDAKTENRVVYAK